MSGHWRAAREVARWEFLRFVKPKQQLVGIIITFVLFLGGLSLGRAARGGEERVREVAVIGSELLPVEHAGEASVRFALHAPTEVEELRGRVRERDLDGLLIIHDVDNAELFVRRSAPWTAEVGMRLSAARQRYAMERAGLSPDVLAEILTPPALSVTHESGGSRGERITMIVVIAIMLMAVFLGMSYIFTSITGEKQIRVTEQVISAIPAQAWIDGKILGLLAVSLVGLVAQALAFAAALLAHRGFTGAGGLRLPATLGDPWTIAAIVLFGVLGLCFWFAFLGAVAAMIDDPHSSTRSSFMMLPVFLTALAFVVLPNGSSTMARVLSLLPPTAPSAMPARMLTAEAGAAEVLLSLALLCAGVWLLRIAAGRIFRLGMLMYGKEPSWAEVRRWAMGG